MTKPPSRRCHLAISVCLGWFMAVSPGGSIAQVGPAGGDPQFEAKVQRLEQLLLRRPRRGTAFDMWYRSYADAGRLDELIKSTRDRAEAPARDASAQVLWGMLCEQVGEHGEAERAYRRAEELAPDDYYIPYLCGDMLAGRNRLPEAVALLEKSLQRAPPPADYLTIAKQLGQIHLRMGNTDGARSTWTKIVERFPNETRFLVDLAKLLGEQGEYGESIQLWRKVQQHPRSDATTRLEAHVAIAQLNLDAGHLDTAIQMFGQALDRVKPDGWRATDIRRRIESALLGSGDVDGLVAFYQRRLEGNPQEVETRLQLARFLSQSRRHDEALAQYRAALERAPQHQELREGLVAELVRRGDYREAISQAEKGTELSPGDPDPWYQLALLYLRQQASADSNPPVARAIEALRRMADIRPGDPQLALKAAEACRSHTDARIAVAPSEPKTNATRKAERSDRDRQLIAAAEAFYREASRRAPGVSDYDERLGEFLNAVGRRQDALDSWNAMVVDDTAAQWWQLAGVLSRYGYMEEAIAAGTQALQRDADNPQYRDGQIEFLLKSKAYDDAWAQVVQWSRLDQDPVWEEKAIRRRVEVAAASGRLDQEVRRLRKTVAQGAATVTDLWTLSLMLARRADFSAAGLFLSQAIRRSGEDVRLLRSMADITRSRGDVEGTLRQLRRLAELDSRNRSAYCRQIVELELHSNRISEAKATVDRLTGGTPPNADVYALQAAVAFRRQDPNAGMLALRRAVQLAPANLEYRTRLAQRWHEQGRATDAIDEYWRCFELAPSQEEKMSILSRISDAAGPDHAERVADRLRGLRRQQEDPRLLTLCLAQVLATCSKSDEALVELKDLYSRDPRDVAVLRQIVQIAQEAGQLDTAITFQQRLAAFEPSLAHLETLADLYTGRGQSGKAEEAWGRLLDAAMDDGDIAQVVDRRLRAGDLVQALALARAARARWPGRWSVHYRLGLAHLALGDTEAAERALARVVETRPEAASGAARSPDDDPSAWPVSGPRAVAELQWLDAARTAYDALQNLVLRRPGKDARDRARPVPETLRVLLSGSFLEARQNSAVALLVLGRQPGNESSAWQRLIASPRLGPTFARLAVIACYGAGQISEVAPFPRLLAELPTDDPLRHVIPLLEPPPLPDVTDGATEAKLASWRKMAHDSYQWLSRHRPELARQLSVPYGSSLNLMMDHDAVAGLVTEQLDQARGLADYETILPLVHYLDDAAVQRRFLLGVEKQLDDDEAGEANERQLQKFLEFAVLRVSAAADDDAQVRAALTVLDRFLARSQLISGWSASGPDQAVRVGLQAAESYWTTLVQRVRRSQQTLLRRENLSTQEKERRENRIQKELTRIRRMSPAVVLAPPPTPKQTHTLTFPCPTAHLDAYRLDVLRRLLSHLARAGRESDLHRLLDQRCADRESPDRDGWTVAKACALWWSGERTESVTRLAGLCEEKPQDSDLRLAVAKAYCELGQVRDAAEHVKRLLAMPTAHATEVDQLRQHIVKEWSTVAKVYDLVGHSGVVRSVAFSPDSRFLASASVDRTIRIWDVAKGTLHATLTGHADMVLRAVFSPDGRTLASSGYDHTVRLWDMPKGEVREALPGHTDVVRALAFSPDGTLLASAGDDKSIRLWDVSVGKEVAVLTGHQAKILTLVFSSDGMTLASGGADGSIQLWDTKAAQLRTSWSGHSGFVSTLIFYREDETLISAGSGPRIKFWDPASRNLRSTLDVGATAVHSLALSPNGRWIVTGCDDGTVRLWDLSLDEARFDYRSHHHSVQPVVAFSPDGRRVATAGYEGTVRLWRADVENEGEPDPELLR